MHEGSLERPKQDGPPKVDLFGHQGDDAIEDELLKTHSTTMTTVLPEGVTEGSLLVVHGARGKYEVEIEAMATNRSTGTVSDTITIRLKRIKELRSKP